MLPAEVEKVMFTITTPGVAAQILDARDEGIYGMTNDPKGVLVRKSEEPLELILRAKGHEDERFTIIPDQDKRFEKPLTPRAVAPRDRDKPRPKHDTRPKIDTKPATETKTKPPENDDTGLGTDLKNPFGKK